MSLEETLGKRLQGELVIVGIGNLLRRDDAAGVLVARRLRPAPGVRVIEAEEVPEAHLGPIVAARPQVVLLIDAVDLGAAPGSVAIVERADLAPYPPSPHRVPVSLLMGLLARETGADVLLLAIQPRKVDLGWAPTPEVGASVDRVAAVLERILDARRPRARAVAGSERC